MDLEPLRISLATVRAQATALEAEVEERRRSLQAAEQRLTNLQVTAQGLERILGEDDGQPALEPEDDGDQAIKSDDESLTPPPTTGWGGVEVRRPRRVPSTDWVAEVVNQIGHPAGRDEIMNVFAEVKGIPESWQANPRNSFNNALGRAVERGMVLKLGDDLFGPLGLDPQRAQRFYQPGGR